MRTRMRINKEWENISEEEEEEEEGMREMEAKTDK
jgi:hypothetical protein